MSKPFAKMLSLASAALLALAPALAGEEGTGELALQLSKLESRLPGSENFNKALEAIESKLKAAGLPANRMTFNTLVPKTLSCDFKAGGKPIAVAPLGPDGFALTTTGGKQLTGPLAWIGDGSLEEMNGRKLEGSIAVMRFRSPNMKLAFSQGAKAVVFVGDGSETQWQVASHFTEVPSSVPRVFIDAKAAAESQLLELAAAGAEASLSIRSSWEETQTANLWTAIPGEQGANFHLDREEAVVFGAVLDTFGTVPGLCPQPRQAANCALLADLACSLAKSGFKPKRTLVFIFFGSHYSAQEGARNFYFAVDKSMEGGLNNDPLTVREGSYRDELDMVEKQLQIIAQPDIFKISDPELAPYTFPVVDKLSKKLDGWVNNLNFEIQKAVLEGGKRPTDEQQERIDKLKGEKTRWNDLRRQIMKREIKTPESMARLLEDLRSSLEAHKAQAARMLENNASFLEIGGLLKGKAIVGHFDLNFSDAETPWTFNMAGDARLTRLETGDYQNDISVANFSKSMSILADLYRSVESPSWKAKLLLDSMSGLYNPNSLCMPLERSTPANVAPAMGIYGYQLMSAGDSLDSDELPYFRPPPDLSGLSPMLQALARAMGDDESMSIRGPMMRARSYHPLTYFRSGGKYFGTCFMGFSNGSASELEGTPDNAIVAVIGGNSRFKRTPIPGYCRLPLGKIAESGYVFIPGVAHTNSPTWTIGAFGFDDNGLLNRFPASGRKDRLFYGYGGSIFPLFNPLNYGIPGWPRFLNAKNNSGFRNSCSYFTEGVCSFYYDKPYDFKWICDGLTMIGAEAARPLGYGLPFDNNSMVSTNVLAQVANDYCVLNQSRLDILRRKNIVNDSIETIHADASEHLSEAVEARKSLKLKEASAHETFSAALGYRACKPLRDISNDMVQAVVVLLILSIPFSFFLERLLFGFTSIYKQVGGFAGFFVATFALLYVIHPAFSLASAPVVIFLAFVIVIMSALVIYIVMSKFKLELRAIQGLSSTVHGASSESSTAMASVLIGITGMRNRPLKTFLTAATVILLTFTILVFASFSSKIGVVESYFGKGLGPDRIEIHRFTLLNIPAQFVDSVRSLYSKDWDVFTRTACFNNPLSQEPIPEKLVLNLATGKAVKIDALLGFDPQEFERNPDLRQILASGMRKADPNALPQIFLSPTVAESLGLREGEPVSVCGRKFSFGGSFNTLALDEAVSLDGSKSTPPDYAATSQEGDNDPGKLANKESEGGQQIDTSSFTYFPSQQTAICPSYALRDLSPICNFIMMYPKAGADMKAAAKELAGVFQGPVYAKGSDGVRQYFFTKEVKASGFSEVIVPLLLGGLIIFSSLLGSIIERSKEIFTYSALGLAPPDVGTLFFAESSVYAVLGGMGGYLFSQLIAFGLSLLAAQGLFHPPEMNFSSLSSVLTILIVMSTVMLSTIYPALKAGKSANPGVARRWKMPSPEGDKLKFVFPFTVSAGDMGGILRFIGEHFENHGDASLGNFAANAVEQERAAGSQGIKATISLAPFDLGVFQSFKMFAKPSEIAGIDEVVVEIERLNGTQGAWLRGNRIFIDELRNQFLLWRSLPAETVANYKSQTSNQAPEGA